MLIRKYGTYGRESFDKYQIYPILTSNHTLEDILKNKGETISEIHSKFLFCYIWNEEGGIIMKGRFSSLYDTWGIFTEYPLNFIQQTDLLYYEDHDEHMYEDSVGIIYSVNN